MRQVNTTRRPWRYLLKIPSFPCFKKNKAPQPGSGETNKILSSIQEAIDKMNVRVDILQSEIEQLKSFLDGGNCVIEKYIVERMNVDRFELNVEAIDVEQVNGALNVGITHNSVVHRARNNQGMGPPHQNNNQEMTKKTNKMKAKPGPGTGANDQPGKKYTMTFFPNRVTTSETVHRDTCPGSAKG